MDKKLLDILVCPISHKPLYLSEDKKFLVNSDKRYVYPIIDGIPHLSPDHVVDKFKEDG